MEETEITLQTAALAALRGFYDDVALYPLTNQKHTQALLQKWLREKHNIYVMVGLDATSKPKFCPEIYEYSHFANYDKIEPKEWFLYRTYEEALEDGLQVALHSIKPTK